MQKARYSIVINAPKERVWHTMLDDATYRQWTNAFHEGSYYQGSWEQGSKILFLGPDENGKADGGMIGRIAENRPYEFVSIEMLGMIENGVEDTTSEAVKKWTPAHENYTFTEKDGATEVVVDIDVADEYQAMFDEMWPRSLKVLKELAEK
ncbi:MAG: SRPBCC domain-containing protein [Candidatus Buchananbacteria bacterium]|nr:SRPBCC domain-containing protein [Candidatus Buchananbacteria bacterium]